jgi:hypothetical protein
MTQLGDSRGEVGPKRKSCMITSQNDAHDEASKADTITERGQVPP